MPIYLCVEVHCMLTCLSDFSLAEEVSSNSKELLGQLKRRLSEEHQEVIQVSLKSFGKFMHKHSDLKYLVHRACQVSKQSKACP